MSTALLIGGARSGKSGYALRAALAHGGPVYWIATAEAFDPEMAERIRQHRTERPAHWQTCEEALELGAALRASRADFVVVDCLTLWLSNWLCRSDPDGWARARADLLAAVAGFQGQLYLISNEVGSGIVPDNPLARQFRDEAGRLHQDLAAQIESVTLIVAGLPLALKRP